MASVNLRAFNAFRGQSRTFLKLAGTIGAAGAAYGYYKSENYGNNNSSSSPPGKKYLLTSAGLYVAAKESTDKDNYQVAYNDIAKKIEDNDEFDLGSYGPILVRLAWHQSGTFRKNPKFESGCPYSANPGGSFAGGMRFPFEADDPGNPGLNLAREFLEEFKDKYGLSYGDLYTLGGVVAVQELGGPKVNWRSGRQDIGPDAQAPHGRLPDASQGAAHIREVFGPDAMGFNDQEIVALIGAHCLGKCHKEFLSYDGPWTFSPTVFTNAFFDLLVNEKWHLRKWDGPKQYEDDATNSLMMLPADYALIEDPKFKKFVVKYAKDEQAFFKDFSKAFQKLLELGIEFPKSNKEFTFKTLEEQGL